MPGSPALDAGEPTSLTTPVDAWTLTGLTTDIGGNSRPQNTTVDMGAFEGEAKPPVIYSFSPLTAEPGDVVTITGIAFSSTPANNIVFFGATQATVTAATATSLTVEVPTGATYAPITVLNTKTTLACFSRSNFTPVFSPAKTGITVDDFLPKQDFTTGSAPESVAIGDLDGDGKLDLVIANSTSKSVSVLRNTSSSGSISSGSFATKQDFTTATSPRSVAIGDLDGDGKPDLAIANTSSNSVSILRNTSSSGNINSGSFAAKQDITTGSAPVSVAIGDLDGDGKLDLVVANSSSNSVSVLRNSSSSGSINSGSFAAKQHFITGTSPTSIAIGDLDGDGKPDLAIANYGSRSVSVLRNANSNADLSALTISQGSLSPTFDVATTSYTAAVSNPANDNVITISPSLADAIASVTVNGVAVNSGNASGNINLNVGDNVIDVEVTAENGSTKTYTITVTFAEYITISDVSITQPTCGTPSGTIVITAETQAPGALEYSIDNGLNYQSATTFTGLTGGSYNIIVQEAGTTNNRAYESNPIKINSPFSATAIYVDINATGNNDGSSWTDAYTDLQDAIDNQCGSLDIWVAAGTYFPISSPDGLSTDLRDKSFHLDSDMKIYGGFKGVLAETQLSDRDWTSNVTILSGKLNATDSSYHVLVTANLNNTAVIDGFTITAGNANGSLSTGYSGRSFERLTGGGMINRNSSPIVRNITFTGNSAEIGGAMYNFDSSPYLINSLFYGNIASNSAGAVYNRTLDESSSISTLTVTNCTFSGNSGANTAGAIRNHLNYTSFVTNTIFWNNTKLGQTNLEGSDIDNSGQGTNSATVTYSITQENSTSSTGTGIINNQDPLFIDAANGFLQLKCNSSAINAGGAAEAPLIDITGFARVGLPDIGAFEYGQAVLDYLIPDGLNPNISGIPEVKGSSQILNTNTVLLQGINNVHLLPGFSVAPVSGAASVFRAEIGGGCP
ncbi:FG-GAP-like repeat-containing protein [Arcticibacterium luteifluviistationis]|uniref:Cadherin-like beta sandwich domain-containing protein n=1 Tax=Arcticibacterium luteifluviistationis TaxID=1784714 RepID=A0A2Z4GF37_9BACT|nr:FG-GAP-like repeat-containing protein [Arcticibacterium luteifluviistationis]AWV99403.1 hypothetical protein DJ013_15035 [Arcticibacterium luteifluviistationis]